MGFARLLQKGQKNRTTVPANGCFGGFCRLNFETLASACADVLNFAASASGSRIVALYKVARREAPDVFQALWIQTAVRLWCMIPSMVLLALGYWWGYDLWSKLTNKTPYLLANVPLGQGEPRDVLSSVPQLSKDFCEPFRSF